MTRPRFDVDARLVIAAITSLAAGLIVLAVTRAPATTEIVTAISPLPPGVPIRDLPIETVRVVEPGGALLASDLEAVSHLPLGAALDAGDPILRSLLVPPAGRRPNVIGLTLRPEHAVHGDLVAGDTVAVYGLRDDRPPRRLSSSVLVLAALPATTGLGAGDVAVLLAVDDRLALDLIDFGHQGGLYLVRMSR